MAREVNGVELAKVTAVAELAELLFTICGLQQLKAGSRPDAGPG